MNKPDINQPRKGLRNTIYGCYIGVLLCSSYAFLYQNQFEKQGYIHIGKGMSESGFINITGETALRNIRAYWGGAAFFLILGIALNIRMIYLIKSRKLLPDNPAFIDPPTYVICPKCHVSYWGKETPDMKCLKCKTIVEDAHGFYERHPNLRPHHSKKHKKRWYSWF